MPDKTLQDLDKQELLAEVEKLQGKLADLQKRKKFGLVWEAKPEDVVTRCHSELPVLREVKGQGIAGDALLPTNLLIEGDNYHALSVLNYTHRGKVDVIYIDPPYNTGAKDWQYNNNYVDATDGYRHSKWLSMMANRLQLAKRLLTQDGVLICAIDENERARLELLLEELFPTQSITAVSVVHNPQGVQGKNFSYTHEYLLFVVPPVKNRIGKIDVEPRTEIFRDDTGNSYLRTNAKNCFYPVFIKGKKIVGFGDVPPDDFHPADRTVKAKSVTEVWPIRDGVERKWRYARQSVGKIKDDLIVKATMRGDDIFQIKKTGTPKTVWMKPAHHAGGKYGTKLLNELIGEGKFNYPKSLFSVVDALKISTGKNSLVLDFFAGSGTTGHAVALLNKGDGGARRFILCTNNEGGIAREVCRPRIKAVFDGHPKLPEITGMGGNLKYYCTDFVPAAATDPNKLKLTKRATEMLCVREDTFTPVQETPEYKLFRNGDRYTGIVYNDAAIDEFKGIIAELDGAFTVYVFSLGGDDFAEDFAELPRVQTRPIPQGILQTYRQLFKAN